MWYILCSLCFSKYIWDSLGRRLSKDIKFVLIIACKTLRYCLCEGNFFINDIPTREYYNFLTVINS
jgi:hypothetical protein